MSFLKSKKKYKKWTLQDCKDFFNKNSEYRYAVVVGLDKLPRSMCKTLEEAKEDERMHFMSGGRLPTQIIDLIFWEG